MKKNETYLLVAICIVIVTIFCSYLLFNKGFTNNLFANVANSINVVEYDDGGKSNYNNYPIIDNVFNSSGEKLVNTDIALTINASSRYNITNVNHFLVLLVYICILYIIYICQCDIKKRTTL